MATVSSRPPNLRMWPLYPLAYPRPALCDSEQVDDIVLRRQHDDPWAMVSEKP